jgi:Na+-transporting methylmalonyl-CoA/oxaloacetate decarboxylase gamma subunit
MSADALGAGLRLTWMGMGLVFLLLAALWALIALLLRLDRARPVLAAAPATAAAEAPRKDAGFPPELLAVIYTATRLHRRALRQRAAPEVRVHAPGSLPSRWIGSGRSRTNRSWAPRGGRR